MRPFHSIALPLLGTLLLAACGRTPTTQSSAEAGTDVASLIADAQIDLPNSPAAGLQAQNFAPLRFYFVDSVGGSDANGGTSPGRPWKSLAP